MTDDQTLGDLRAAAVKIITSAARLRTADGQQYDIADFIAAVLSSAAANLGDPEALLAGRSGSWEAGYVRQLIEGTIGYDPLDWHMYRTEPITVPLNVAELIERFDLHPGPLGLDEAGDRACDETWPDLDQGSGSGSGSDEEIDELLDHLEHRYADEYRAYGERFQVAIHSLAEAMHLPMVEVELDLDPQSAWWEEPAVHNPDPWGDPIIDELWQRAHDFVRLPNVDIATGGIPTGDLPLTTGTPS